LERRRRSRSISGKLMHVLRVKEGDCLVDGHVRLSLAVRKEKSCARRWRSISTPRFRTPGPPLAGRERRAGRGSRSAVHRRELWDYPIVRHALAGHARTSRLHINGLHALRVKARLSLSGVAPVRPTREPGSRACQTACQLSRLECSALTRRACWASPSPLRSPYPSAAPART